MPLIRVNSRDAESFDTFDVAEMTDDRNQHLQRKWSSRQTSAGGGTALANSWQTKSTTLSPTPETDDLTSIDSSSGRRSEEADGVGSIPSRGRNSMGSVNSYQTLSGTSDNLMNSCNSFNSNAAPYDTFENLDGMQHDPRNPFNKSPNTARSSWGDNNHIPEEDTSLSTNEDSSVTPSVQLQSHYQNQHSRSNKNQLYQTQPQRSQRHLPKQPSEADDVSILSQQSRQEFNKKHANNDNSSHIIQQLESQVAKLNFELATTKSTLDELRLDNRRLTDDKQNLTTNVTLLQEENEQLYIKIERMEKETILRNMEGTKGVVHFSTDQNSSVAWRGDGEKSIASSREMSVTKQRLGKVGGDSLEVPFRSSNSDYHLKRSSLCSVTSIDLDSDDEGASRGDTECRSIALSDGNDDLGISQSSVNEQEDMAQKGRLNILTMIGGGSILSVRETTKQLKEASISFHSRRNGEADKEPETSTRSLPPNKKCSHLEVGETDDDDIGSNPQDEGEDFNDDDPFSTWSAPGDPKRKEQEPEKNWLQRGLGGKGGDGNNSRQPPQSNEMIEDPFDSCNDGQHNNIDSTGKYMSFAENSGKQPHHGDMQDKKRFGLFKGFMGGAKRSAK